MTGGRNLPLPLPLLLPPPQKPLLLLAASLNQSKNKCINGNDINYDCIKYDLFLHKLLYILTKKVDYSFIYTNGIENHAYDVLNALKLNNIFSDIYARDTLKKPKPYIESFNQVTYKIRKYVRNINGPNIPLYFYFFDDLVDNLKTANEYGWTTIWISKDYKNIYNYPFIDMAFPDIYSALIYFIYN